MLEADLDASPRTLRFFVDDQENAVYVTDIPQSINFAVFPSPSFNFLFLPSIWIDHNPVF
jgi:hypothetical protein